MCYSICNATIPYMLQMMVLISRMLMKQADMLLTKLTETTPKIREAAASRQTASTFLPLTPVNGRLSSQPWGMTTLDGSPRGKADRNLDPDGCSYLRSLIEETS